VTYHIEVGKAHSPITCVARSNKQNYRYVLALIALCAAFLLIGARWIWLYRYGQPFDIDEAGYLDIALLDYHGLVRKGLPGWLSAVEKGGGPNAPLTPALTSLMFAIVGPDPLAGFIVVLLIATGVVIVTYHLGKTVASSKVGLAASLLTACCPVVLMYSRSFHFSMPATLMSTLALLAIAKSERFSRLGWSLGFGLCLGLLLLARTMTIAFIPGLLCGAFITIFATPGNRPRRFAIFIAALIDGCGDDSDMAPFELEACIPIPLQFWVRGPCRGIWYRAVAFRVGCLEKHALCFLQRRCLFPAFPDHSGRWFGERWVCSAVR
jgi:hypothetical protein